jgi:hypothetical protein
VIGKEDGPPEMLLFRARHAVRLATGVIVIANEGTHELRFYDSRGRHLKSVGRVGEGPGEFRDISGVWRIRGDSILIWDTDLDRLTRFTSQGEYANSYAWSLQGIALPSGITLTNPLSFFGALSDGSVLAQPNPVAVWALSGIGRQRDTVRVLLFRPDGRLSDTLGTFRGNENALIPAVRSPRGTPPGQKIYSQLIFGEQFMMAVAPDAIAVGLGKPFEVRIYDRTGRLRRVVGRPTPVVWTTREHIRKYKESITRNDLSNIRSPAARESAQARRARYLEVMQFAETLPAYRDLLFDTDGNLWVQEHWITEDEPRHWSVFQPDGRWIGRLETPPDFEILEIGRDYILRRVLDELDVERIQLHRLSRTQR